MEFTKGLYETKILLLKSVHIVLLFLITAQRWHAENCLVLWLACSPTPVCLPTSCSSPSSAPQLRRGLLFTLRYYWAPTLPLPGQRQPLTARLPLLTFRRSETSFGEVTAVAYENKNSSVVWDQLLQCLPSLYQEAHIRKKPSQHRTVGSRPHMLAMTSAKVETTKTLGRNPAPSGIVTIGQ